MSRLGRSGGSQFDRCHLYVVLSEQSILPLSDDKDFVWHFIWAGVYSYTHLVHSFPICIRGLFMDWFTRARSDTMDTRAIETI